MHRRQYTPGSGRNGAPTVSRARLARINKNLLAQRDDANANAKAEREAREKENHSRSLRGRIESVKRFLKRPIRLGRRSA